MLAAQPLWRNGSRPPHWDQRLALGFEHLWQHADQVRDCIIRVTSRHGRQLHCIRCCSTRPTRAAHGHARLYQPQVCLLGWRPGAVTHNTSTRLPKRLYVTNCVHVAWLLTHWQEQATSLFLGLVAACVGNVSPQGGQSVDWGVAGRMQQSQQLTPMPVQCSQSQPRCSPLANPVHHQHSQPPRTSPAHGKRAPHDG